MALKDGDRVEAKVELTHAWHPNVKKGARGTVVQDERRGEALVHFPSQGFGWPEVKRSFDVDLLRKL